MLAHNGVIILLTLLLALVLSIIPMPLSIDAFRPDWVLVVVLYWVIALPNRLNIITAAVMGFMARCTVRFYIGCSCCCYGYCRIFCGCSFSKNQKLFYLAASVNYWFVSIAPSFVSVFYALFFN